VRGVLGVLRAEDGADPSATLVPEPDLSRLPGLVSSLAANGLEVRLDDRSGGADGIPQAAQLAVFRVAQEALTNVLRHSSARTASLAVTREPRGVRVEVEDPGPAQHGRRRDPGRGLLGMRERAELLGGTFSAGPADAGGWRVEALFPIEESR
jgi:signal transduction histidine kinase